MIRNATCPCPPLKRNFSNDEKNRTQFLELDFPTKPSPTRLQSKGIYTWQSSPRMYNNRKANKIPPDTHPQNIMHDRRIFRGSNFGQANNQTEVDGVNKEQEARRRQILRKQHQRSQRGIIGTPPPVKGRRHETIQTDKYLEELLTRPIESDAQCQTDLFLHRPPTPPHIVSSIKSVNVETQVLDGELFDFDAEVEPLLEMMVGRTVEQSLLEVLNEEEYSDLRKQQQEFLSIREAEIAELKRLQNKEFTSKDDKRCQLHQDFSGRDGFMEMQDKVTAAQLLQDHVASRLPGILQAIDPFEEERKEDQKKKEEIERTLGPWLSKEVAEEVGRMIDSHELLEELVREILEDRAAKYLKICEKEGKENH
ncbi:hypothetical protein HA402_016038 [Bradysia odoriphaga]|nr:hypothetical protein HA402_016038 [Bradysia odoriphaga]